MALNRASDIYTYIYWFHSSQIASFRLQMAPNRGLEVSIGSKASFGAPKWFQIESWKPQLVPKQASYSPQANGGLNFYYWPPTSGGLYGNLQQEPPLHGLIG